MLVELNYEILFALYGSAVSNIFFTHIWVFFSEWFPYLVAASVIVYESATADKEHNIFRMLFYTALPSVVVWTCVMLMKHFYPFPRPYAEDIGIKPLVDVSDPFGSFPSAHATFFSALAITMFVNGARFWKWYLFAAIIIAIARVATGVHWPVDVVAGIFFGLTGGFLLAKLLLQKRISLKNHL